MRTTKEQRAELLAMAQRGGASTGTGALTPDQRRLVGLLCVLHATLVGVMARGTPLPCSLDLNGACILIRDHLLVNPAAAKWARGLAKEVST